MLCALTLHQEEIVKREREERKEARGRDQMVLWWIDGGFRFMCRDGGEVRKSDSVVKKVLLGPMNDVIETLSWW